MKTSERCLILGLVLTSLRPCLSATGQNCSSGLTYLNGRCRAVTSCLTRRCPEGSSCVSNISGHYCKCQKGFRLFIPLGNDTKRRPECADVNECRANSSLCGNHAVCHNTRGSYHCTCSEGYFSSSKQTIFTDGGTQCKACKSQCRNRWKPCFSRCYINGPLNKLLAVADTRRTSSHLRQNASRFLAIADEILRTAVETLPDQNKTYARTENFGLEMQRLETSTVQQTISLCVSGNWMEVNTTAFTGDQGSNGSYFAAALLVYRAMESLLDGSGGAEAGSETSPRHEALGLNTKVLTAVVLRPPTQSGDHPVLLTFKHVTRNKTVSNVTCVYWESSFLGWSPLGCELVEFNRSHTKCNCSHLSSFAVLMALKDLPDVFELQIITYVGLGVSLVCLLLAFTMFWCCPPRPVSSVPKRSTRNAIHKNLCATLFVGNLLFLMGISQTEIRAICGIIAGMLHYTFLSAFSWMLLEAVELYCMMEIVFPTNLKRYIYWVGYGPPALIVGVSAAANPRGYGTSKHCWLDTERYFSCSFFVPVAVITVINFLLLCKTLVKVRTEMLRKSERDDARKQLEDIRIFSVTAIGQVFLLGLTWVFGAFFIQTATVPMMYLFTIFNSLQGMFIFILHCLVPKKMREALLKWLRGHIRWGTARRWTLVSSSSTRSSSNQGPRRRRETETTSTDLL